MKSATRQNSSRSSTRPQISRKLLVFLLADSLEKTLRVRAIIGSHRRDPTGRYGRILTNYEKLLRDCLVLSFERNSGRIREFLESGKGSADWQSHLLGIAENALKIAFGTHETLVVLPRGQVRPELYAFLRDAFGNTWNDAAPSIMLSTLYNAHEYGFEDMQTLVQALDANIGRPNSPPELAVPGATSRESGPVLELAFIDNDAPLSWPILCHEFGHALERKYKVSDRAVKDIAEADRRWKLGDGEKDDKSKVFSKWISEAFADLVSAHVCGPIGMLPILLVELVRPLVVEIGDTHPPTLYRIAIVREYLKSADLSFEPFSEMLRFHQEDQKLKASELAGDDLARYQKDAVVAEYFSSTIAPQLHQYVQEIGLPRFTEEDMKKANSLAETLREGLPISGIRVFSPSTISRAVSNAAKSNDDCDAIYAALEMLNEVPNTAAVILTAGWLHKLRTFRSVFRQLMTAESVKLGEYSDYFHLMDGLLLKSVELAEVHARLAEHNASFRA